MEEAKAKPEVTSLYEILYQANDVLISTADKKGRVNAAPLEDFTFYPE
jgi:hypothetical protein